MKRQDTREADRQLYVNCIKRLADAQSESKAAIKTLISIMRRYDATEDEILSRLRSDLQPYFKTRLNRTDIKSLIKGAY